MKVTVIPGVTYAVTPAAECTVTTLEGVLIASCPAGEQTLFVAPSAEVEVSDDTALVTESFKGAPAGSSAAGGVRMLYEHATQTPAEGNLSNVNTYGWAMVATQAGRLDSVALAPRSAGGVADHWPVYLKIWVADGNNWRVLGTSLNTVAQVAGVPSVWRFAGINLEAGQKIQLEARKTPESTAHDSRLSASVVANTLADTGCIDASGRLTMTDWVPQYTLSLSRETGIGYRGIQLAEQADLDAHTGDAVRHITGDERTAWNAKADASALSGKVNTGTFNSHASDAVKHITAGERAAWNAKQNALLDEHENLIINGEVRTTSGVYGSSLNGTLGQQNKIDIGYFYLTKSGAKSLHLMRSRLGADGPYIIFRVNDDMSVEFIQNVKFGGSVEFGNVAANQVAALIDARLRALGQIYLVVAPTTLSSPAAGATHSAVVTTNADGDLTVSSSQPWATVSVSGSTLTITAAANPNAATREAVVTVSVQGVSATATITQDAAPTPEQPTA